MAIICFLNYKVYIEQFYNEYTLFIGLKPLLKDDMLKEHYQKKLEYLYNYLETFYKVTLMVKGNSIGFANYFQTFDWLLDQLNSIK